MTGTDRSAGWFADPTGRFEQRYWDGQRWTDRVASRGEIRTDPRGVEPDPPVAVPAGRWMPPVPPSSRRGAWPWALAAGLLAFVVGVGGCVAVSAVVTNRVADEVRERRDRHAITLTQYEEIELGMTREQVIAQVGKEPQRASDLVVDEVFGADAVGADCISYLEEGDLLFPSFQFCFDEGNVLVSKASN